MLRRLRANRRFAFDRPAKKKVFLKPDKIEHVPNSDPKVLYLRGLWTQFFRVDEAVKAAMPKADVTDGWLDASPVGLTFTYFPADYPNLMSNDLIVLAVVTAPEQGAATANLLAPIVIDPRKRIGIQAVRLDSRYSHQQPLPKMSHACL